MTHQQHLQMGLRKGMAILIYYVVGETKFQAALLADDSVVGRGGKGENRLWKRVTPIVTEFAWLPPAIAESFCRTALYRETARTYHAFDIPHLGLETKRFDAYMRVEDIFYLGDTRSADDLTCFAFNSSVLGSLTAPCSSGSARAGIFTDISLLFFPYSKDSPLHIGDPPSWGVRALFCGSIQAEKSPSQIVIKGDNRAVIDLMTHKGKFRRTDLPVLLHEAQHLLSFSLPPSPGQCHTHFDDGTHREQNVG